MSGHYPGVAAENPTVISFCVVNTNGRDDLLACLDSIFRHPPTGEFEVMVIDNASEDGSAEAVRAAYGDGIELLALDRRRSKAENDSELTDGAAAELLRALEAAPAAAAAGAQLCDPDGVPRPSAWRFPGVRSALAGALFLHGPLTVQSRGEEVREVDWVQSAGMLVRKRAFEEVGPLDPRFFVYSDEVDWQKRAHDAGWSVIYVPGARIVHHEQLSGGAGAARRIVEFSRNRDAYVRKHEGGASAAAVRVLTAWTYALRALAALVLPRHSPRRYARHAYHSLFPGRGEGIREAAEELNRRKGAT
jgi:N-acetylglucosaminyl-diphospho-decaprenol L-rhamnosyltransferase